METIDIILITCLIAVFCLDRGTITPEQLQLEHKQMLDKIERKHQKQCK